VLYRGALGVDGLVGKHSYPVRRLPFLGHSYFSNLILRSLESGGRLVQYSHWGAPNPPLPMDNVG